MLKRLVTLQELIETSAEITLSNINLDLDLNTALQNWDNLTKIDRQTFRIQQYLDQAGRQIDSLSNGQIYNMWDYLNQVIEAGPNQAFSSIDIANFKRDIDTIKYVVIQWVEYFIQTNKIFSDTNIEAPSNLTFNIQGQSSNSDIERKRLDLINTLNTTFFFNKIYVSGNVEQDRFNPLTDLGQFSGLEIGNIDSLNYKFRNGYIVKDVDYLGLENKGRLDLLEPRVEECNTKINQNTINIKQLQDLTNTHTRDIDSLKKKTQQNTDYIQGFYNQYTQYTTQNDKNIQDINNKLSSLSGGLNYVGVWNSLTTYSRGNVVSYNNKFYASNIDNNLGISPENNPTQWTKLPSIEDAQVDEKVNALRQELQPQITENANNIIELRNQTAEFELDIEELREGLNETKSQVETNKEDITTLRKDQNDLGDHLTEEVNRLEEEIKNVKPDTSNLAKLNEDNLFTNQTNYLRYDWDAEEGRKGFPLVIQTKSIGGGWYDIMEFDSIGPGIKFINPGQSLSYIDISRENYPFGKNHLLIEVRAYNGSDDDKTNRYRFVPSVEDALNSSANEQQKNQIVLNLGDADKRYALKNEAGGNYLKTDTQEKQEVQGPVNFSNLTINNDRVLTTSDLGDVSQFVTTNTQQTINANKIIHQNCTWVYRGSSLRLETTDGSSNIGIKNNGGVLVDLGNNPYVNVGTDNTYNTGVRNIFRTLPEVYTEKTLPTKKTEFTTKKYVDDAIAGISVGTPDNMVTTDTTQTITGKKLYTNTPTDDSELTNKKYVDDTIANIPSGGKLRVFKLSYLYLNYRFQFTGDNTAYYPKYKIKKSSNTELLDILKDYTKSEKLFLLKINDSAVNTLVDYVIYTYNGVLEVKDAEDVNYSYVTFAMDAIYKLKKGDMTSYKDSYCDLYLGYWDADFEEIKRY